MCGTGHTRDGWKTWHFVACGPESKFRLFYRLLGQPDQQTSLTPTPSTGGGGDESACCSRWSPGLARWLVDPHVRQGFCSPSSYRSHLALSMCMALSEHRQSSVIDS